jgi:dimethylamine/trimethylamine dehydrogenase
MEAPMARDPRYDILFEPVRIGPVTARNRFYQVPHCNGMGHRFPASQAAMRGVKAEGGWAVVATEEVEIHHTSDITPYVEGRLWDDADIPPLAALADAVHAHGSLAAIELCHNSFYSSNNYSREIPLGPSHGPAKTGQPHTARAMDKSDIAAFRRWHRNAALRSKKAGFDLIYVYAGHDLTILQHFMSRRFNHRTDEYGGSLENRVRLFREVIEDTKDAVGDTCAVVVRMAVDEMIGEDGLTHQGEGHDIVAMLAELPDLWDVNISDWPNDSVTARFGEEGAQEDYIRFVKKLTTKPVVGVGRYTSPDAMVRVIRQGIMDMIGAARPSIADPFLPAKIEQGRLEDIRECIGCNICVSGDYTMSPIRCTQNPTMGEEWRRGWHPERIAVAKTKGERVLIVGAGPAGLEAARALGARGYDVALADARDTLGGRVTLEARLPGLASYARVRDWRLQQLTKLADVETYPASLMQADDVFGFGATYVVLATGCHWRRDAVGPAIDRPVAGLAAWPPYTPDDFLLARVTPESLPDGPVVLYDDDHYYMGGVLAELLAKAGRSVTLVTPAADVSHWTHYTMEQVRIQTRLLELGVTLRPHRLLVGRATGTVEIACTFTGKREMIDARTLVLVTSRLPEQGLAFALAARQQEWQDAGIDSVTTIGDARGPGTIAAAIYAGHRFARELGETIDPDVAPFRRERVTLQVT